METHMLIKADAAPPLLLQRIRVGQARNRPQLLRRLRCILGEHNPPYDRAFDEYGAVNIGGACTNCPDQVDRIIVFIGNYWDFGQSVDECLSAMDDHIVTLQGKSRSSHRLAASK